jgi:hypothetical protein
VTRCASYRVAWRVRTLRCWWWMLPVLTPSGSVRWLTLTKGCCMSMREWVMRKQEGRSCVKFRTATVRACVSELGLQKRRTPCNKEVLRQSKSTLCQLQNPERTLAVYLMCMRNSSLPAKTKSSSCEPLRTFSYPLRRRESQN